MKIAFIVQPDWLEVHFGVRNLFVSCFKILEQKGHNVHFVSFKQNFDKVIFYRDIVDDEDLKSNVKTTTIGTKYPYKKLLKANISEQSVRSQFLGEDISNDYDAFIITNPWLIEYPLNFGTKPVSLICYDCCANSLSILDLNNDYFSWGFAHNIGYQHGIKNGYHFLSISEKTDKEIVDFYNPNKHSFLTPVPTYAFFDIDYSTEQKKEKAIILAAPFDERKGLIIMPEILNQLKEDIDTLYIYGVPRCGRKLYKNFYKNLQVKNVIHYNKITADDLIKLYKKCKLLLFPSREEGLGMPIIEAQLCGCRVATTNDTPMNQLLCNGGYLLTNDIKADVNNIKIILYDDNFDYCKLNVEAREKFSTNKIYYEILNSIKQ